MAVERGKYQRKLCCVWTQRLVNIIISIALVKKTREGKRRKWLVGRWRAYLSHWEMESQCWTSAQDPPSAVALRMSTARIAPPRTNLSPHGLSQLPGPTHTRILLLHEFNYLWCICSCLILCFIINNIVFLKLSWISWKYVNLWFLFCHFASFIPHYWVDFSNLFIIEKFTW